MNMQAMLKQAQALQKDMMKVKDEIEKSDFCLKGPFHNPVSSVIVAWLRGRKAGNLCMGSYSL